MEKLNSFIARLGFRRRTPRLSGESGAGLLSVVTGMGVVAAMVQGSLYYQAKTSHAFIAGEANKTLAREMAEAGIEANIADIGIGSLSITPNMAGYATYQNEPLGGGGFTTLLTTVGTSEIADTVDLSSTGMFRGGTHSIFARLRVGKYIDTSVVINMNTVITPRDSAFTELVPSVVTTTTQMDPHDMPPLSEQPAYDACMASAAVQCQICHLPPGNVENRQVIDVAKPSIRTHIDHHGDYVTTDGSCDMYDPVETTTTIYNTVTGTVTVMDTTSIFEEDLTISERSRVKILSWK